MYVIDKCRQGMRKGIFIVAEMNAQIADNDEMMPTASRIILVYNHKNID